MKKLLILFICGTVFSSMHAQKDFIEGYYVTLANDTVKAKIKQLDSQKEIKVLHESGDKKTLTVKDIKAYSLLGVSNYRVITFGGSTPFGSKSCFALVVEDGPLMLFGTAESGKITNTSDLMYWIQKEETLNVHLPVLPGLSQKT